MFMISRRGGLMSLGLMLFSTTALAQEAPAGAPSVYPLVAYFDDGAGDSGAPVDLASMRMSIDNSSGAYEIVLRSTAADPFEGDFRINLNLFNPDVGTTDCAAAQFVSVENDYSLGDPVQELLLQGIDDVFNAWSPGDRVATTSDPFGGPDCSPGFTSALNGIPSTGSNLDEIDDRGNFSTLIRLPGPLFKDRFEPVPAEPNRLPVAGPSRSVTASEDQIETITLTGSDADGDALTFEIVAAPASGSLSSPVSTGSTSASVDYTPNAEFSGQDSFTYRATDGAGFSLEATINVTVAAVNDPPETTDDSATVDEDSSKAVAVLDNDSDPDGTLDPTSVSVTVAASNGGTSIDSTTGVVTYTPNADFFGEDSFVYQVCDDGNPTPVECAEATVTMTVAPVSDPPETVADTATVDEDSNTIVSVLDNDSDPDGDLDPSSVSVTSAPSDGSTAVNATTGAVTYTPDPDFFGQDSFAYEVCDHGNPSPVECASATVSVTIEAVNDAPSFTAEGDIETAPSASLREYPGWATFTSAGPANESTQGVLRYEVTTSFDSFFTEQPQVSPNGTLTFATNDTGVANITVRVVDDGGTANGGDDTSASQTYQISSSSGGISPPR